mmetsp:Transcript_9722/g.27094  ORF Transcript_9722/g.27094 Transcript_9722/m.27094 type:complete len:267 (-) Transcript_9722:502-1302(-)
MTDSTTQASNEPSYQQRPSTSPQTPCSHVSPPHSQASSHRPTCPAWCHLKPSIWTSVRRKHNVIQMVLAPDHTTIVRVIAAIMLVINQALEHLSGCQPAVVLHMRPDGERTHHEIESNTVLVDPVHLVTVVLPENRTKGIEFGEAFLPPRLHTRPQRICDPILPLLPLVRFSNAAQTREHLARIRGTQAAHVLLIQHLTVTNHVPHVIHHPHPARLAALLHGPVTQIRPTFSIHLLVGREISRKHRVAVQEGHVCSVSVEVGVHLV